MPTTEDVKPYFLQIRDWKIRNMVMLYWEAREMFMANRRVLRRNGFLPFDKMKAMSDILYEIKEQHHLIFKRLVDPQKKKFEKSRKIMPDEIETEFMNNVGMLFHKLMVMRELKYSMDHYVEANDALRKSEEALLYQLNQIVEELFGRGVEILTALIRRHKDNIFLLTLLLDDPKRTKRHVGQDVNNTHEQFVDGRGLDEVYYSVGRFYAQNGWNDKAKRMLNEVLKRNPGHQGAKTELDKID
jgi:hypothetical protein